MKVGITEKNENPLMNRQEIEFEVEHRNAPTPSRSEVVDGLSSELGVSKDLIVVEKMSTPHGLHKAFGIARVYESSEKLEELESEHYIKRTKESIEKTGEAEEVETEEVEEKEESEEVEEKPEETEPEEVEEKEEKQKEEKEEEPSEEEETEEAIDYQELSELNITDIKEKSEEIDLDYQRLLEAEKKNKDRKTLKKWIEENIKGES